MFDTSRIMGFEVGQKVWYKGKKAIIADKEGGAYALWDETGKKEIPGEIKLNGDTKAWWVPASKIAIRD